MGWMIFILAILVIGGYVKYFVDEGFEGSVVIIGPILLFGVAFLVSLYDKSLSGIWIIGGFVGTALASMIGRGNR